MDWLRLSRANFSSERMPDETATVVNVSLTHKEFFTVFCLPVTCMFRTNTAHRTSMHRFKNDNGADLATRDCTDCNLELMQIKAHGDFFPFSTGVVLRAFGVPPMELERNA